MYTLSDVYVRKFSSGLIIALLALSALLVLVPAVTTVAAASQKSPTFAFAPSVIAGCTSGPCDFQDVQLTISNPSSNPYAITAFTVTVPSTWTFETSSSPVSTYFSCTVSSTSIACDLRSATAPLPPGASDTINGYDFGFAVEPPVSTTFPLTGTFTTSVQDASSAAYYPGSSFTAYAADPTTESVSTIALSPTTTPYVAGSSPYTVTLTVGGSTTATEAGLPVTWSIVTGFFGSVSPTSAKTSASGTAATTFTPTNTAHEAGEVMVVLGNAPTGELTPFSWETAPIETVPGAPATVLLTYDPAGDASASSAAFPTTQYQGNIPADVNATASSLGLVEVPGTDVFYSVADAFGNAVTAGLSDVSGTITAAGASLCPTPGGPYLAPLVPCADQVTLTAAENLYSANLGTLFTTSGINYWQSGEYGWAGELTISLSGTYTTAAGAVSFGPVRTATNKISTTAYTFTSVKFNDATDLMAPPAPSPTVAAGNTFSPSILTNPWQEGVPFTIQVCVTASCSATTSGYTGTFTATKSAEFSGLTNSTGELQSPFAVDTVAATSVVINATYSQTIDSGTSHFTYVSPTTVVTVAGTAAEFVIQTGFGQTLTPGTANAVTGTSIGVDISLADAYGNPTTAPTTGSPEIQIELTLTGGLLSATSVYIPAGDSSTNATHPASSFGAIYWTLPSSLGTYKISATGVVSGVQVAGSATVTTVTATPTFSVTSPSVPKAGVIYSDSPTVVFSGQANISIGYPATGSTAVTIKDVGYEIGAGTWSNAAVTETTTPGSYGWNAVAFLTAGLNKVVFNTTDSDTNVYLSPSYTVLVDSSTPTVAFTTANGANLTNGAHATATIVVAQGDLNASSVVASVNGTALPSGDVSISGTNALGQSVTYTVSIALPAGSDYVGLSAASLAGLTGTATSITVTVSVPIDQTFQSSGTGLPTFTTVSGFQGVSVTWANNGDSAIAAQFWIQFTGPTTSAEFQGSTVAAGGSTTVFFGTAGLAPGSYTATVYVSVGLAPYSPTYTVTFTVS